MVEALKDADLKASIRLSIALGRIGKPALPFLRSLWEENPPAPLRSLLLYAVSKMRDPEALTFLPMALKSLNDADREVRDTAARTLGKFFEHFGADPFSKEDKQIAFEGLIKLLGDSCAPIRAKATRSLGKMAAQGCLTPSEKDQLKGALMRILGKSSFEWDRAYIVRVEAEEALKLL